MSRIAITGWPKSGKTTLARSFGSFRSTDSVMDRGWSESSEIVSTWFNDPRFVIEGVAVPRALRKWRDRHQGYPPPIDKLIILRTSYGSLNNGQTTMGKGIDTVLAEILPWLEGVDIEVRT